MTPFCLQIGTVWDSHKVWKTEKKLFWQGKMGKFFYLEKSMKVLVREFLAKEPDHLLHQSKQFSESGRCAEGFLKD